MTQPSKADPMFTKDEAVAIWNFQDALDLLRNNMAQFKYYEMNHRDKMVTLRDKDKVIETFDKAEANLAMYNEIKEFLDGIEKQRSE